MAPHDPIAHNSVLRYLPSLSFYDARVDIVREMRTLGLLRQFKIEPDACRMRLFDGVDFTVSVTTAQVNDPLGALDGDTLAFLIALVARFVEPERPNAAISHWSLLPLDATFAVDFKDACVRATRGWIPGLSEQMGMTDVAILADGLWPGSDEVYQCEFGVIEAEHAAPRIARIMSRVTEFDESGTDGWEALLGREYPPLGLFLDAHWWPKVLDDHVDDVEEWFSGLFNRTNEATSDMCKQLEHGILIETHERRGAAQ